MRKKIVLIIFSLLLLIALPLTFLVVQQQQDIRNRAAPATTMQLLSNTNPPRESLQVAVGETFTVDVVLSTEQNQIYSVYAEVNYDQTLVELVSVTNNTSYFQELVTEGTDTPGIGLLHTTTTPDSLVSGNNIRAGSFIFKAIAPGSFSLTQTSKSNAYLYTAEADNPTLGAVITKPAMSIRINNNVDGSNNNLPTGSLTPTEIPTQIPSETITLDETATVTQTITTTLSPTGTQDTLTTTPSETMMVEKQSTTAEPINLEVNLPQNTTTTSDTTPTFNGTAKPGSVISITFSPTGRSSNVTADSLGNWSYTPTQSFSPNSYTIVISASDLETGQNEARTISLIITSDATARISTSTLPTATQIPQQITTADSAITAPQPDNTPELDQTVPVTGSVETTLFITILGIVLLVGGAALPYLMK